MGVMRFRVYPPERITEEVVQQAYLSGIERTSWPVRTTIEGGDLLLQRSVSDSANLHVPWPVEGHEPVTLISGSLMERPEPYLLPLELARGTLVQVRNQLSDWQAMGLAVPEALPAKLEAAVERFSWAVVEQGDPAASARAAEESLRAALDAAGLLAAAFSEQALAVRRGHRREAVAGGQPLGLLGADLGSTLLDNATARLFLQTFNAAQVPILLAQHGNHRGPLHLDRQRSADRVVPQAQAEGAGRAALDARPGRPARLALSVRRRF